MSDLEKRTLVELRKMAKELGQILQRLLQGSLRYL